MEKFTPSEICADIKIYDYKKKVKYDEKSLMILKETGQVIKAGKDDEVAAVSIFGKALLYRIRRGTYFCS